MNIETHKKALDAARLYYEQDWSQIDIAKALNLSRARVSGRDVD